MPATRRGAPDNENIGKVARQYSTRIKVTVNSHQTPTAIEFGDDVVKFDCSKTIKGTGKATLTVTASRNFLNTVFPNDYINIYINRGDHDGWTRVFFGFIDRVSESYKITEKGAPVSNYKISCSDFSKAFDRTNIYFNPAMMGREDFKSSFGAPNIGGVSLYSKGLTAQGSPPDVILQVLFSLFGFGSQFILPEGINPNSKDKLRQERAKSIMGNAGIDSLGATGDLIFKKLDEEKKFSLNLASSLLTGATDAEVKALANKSGISENSLDSSSPEARQKMVELFADRWLVDNIFKGNEDIKRSVVNALSSTRSDAPPSLLDILDVFTFVEREAIDGYMAGTSIWTKQGSLSSFFQSYSNELVNELFWDLRAVNQGEELATDSDFERSADEFSGNFAGDDSNAAQQYGIKYVPALVYREYPFSTIGSFDASKANVGLVSKDGLGSKGILQFGNIFNDSPNMPGRHVIEVGNINLADLSKDQGNATAGDAPSGLPVQNKKAKKHIDVAVVSDQEIISMDIGRSDADHFNLFEIGSDALLGPSVKYITSDVLPIISTIDIEQHGLRVRSVETRFDRFTPPNSPNAASVPAAGPEDAPEQNQEAEEGEGTRQLPIDPFNVSRRSPYGYRIRNASDTDYTFHYGVDLYAPEGTPVRAPVDGTIVVSAPGGPFKNLGNIVVIKHKHDNKYSLYAHLQNRAPIAENLNHKASKRSGSGKDWLQPGGKMPQTAVKAGEVIGYVGTTTGAGTNFTSAAPHCHVEILTGYPANSDAIPPSPRSSPIPANPATVISEDPVPYFQSVIGTTFGALPEDQDNGDEDGEGEDGPGKTEEPESAASAVKAAANVTGPPAPTVDNKAIRYQLLRWVLLQDHWYQHNKEYLSGNITMRGAPDIRVGYRLDLTDRALSFYVESVTHSWTYPGQLVTTLAVTRGQPNNPYPAYVLPAYKPFGATDKQRKLGSRLGTYFITPDPIAVRRATVIRGGSVVGTQKDSSLGSLVGGLLGDLGGTPMGNSLDTPDESGYLFDEKLQFSGESVATGLENEEELVNLLDNIESEEDSSDAALLGLEFDTKEF